MRERWAMRAEIGASQLMRAGDKIDFVTITSHEKLPTFAATEKVWRESAWPNLYAVLKRKKPTLEYMIVPEKHDDGRMHVHALWNADVTKRWLKDNARKRGLGYECDVSHLRDSGRAAQYTAKYLGKSLDANDIPHFRRVRTSQGWPDIPNPQNALVDLRWEHIGTNGALDAVYRECQEKRITLIDIETGALWDDVDLGTIIYA